MIITAPVIKSKALSRPSLILTLAAVILINPGSAIPIDAEINPKQSDQINLILFNFETNIRN